MTVDSYGDGLKVVAPARVVEAMLNTKLYQFTHNKRPVSALRQVGGFSIPDVIAPYIDFIEGQKNSFRVYFVVFSISNCVFFCL